MIEEPPEKSIRGCLAVVDDYFLFYANYGLKDCFGAMAHGDITNGMSFQFDFKRRKIISMENQSSLD